MQETKQVRVGDRDYALAPFRAFKAIHVAAIIAKVSSEARAVIEEVRAFEERYAESHVVRVSEAMAQARGWPVAESSYKVDGKGERYLELPQSASDEEKILVAFPKAYELARTEVTQLLALIVIENDALERAEDEDRVRDELDATGRRLLRAASLGEIVDLLSGTVDMVRDELAGRQEKVGNIRGLFQTPSAPSRPAETPGGNPEQTTPTDVSSDTSTSSLTPTDGPEDAPSLASAGANS